VKLTGSQKRDVCAGQTGRIGPILRVQSTQSERRGGCGADENDPVIRRHRPMLRPGTIRVLLSCRWRCREARLSSELSSAHGAKQRHPHRFLIPGDPALTIGCVKGGEAINVVTSKMPFTRPIGKSDTAEWGGWETSRRGFPDHLFSRRRAAFANGQLCEKPFGLSGHVPVLCRRAD
jgi:hypothetical protein